MTRFFDPDITSMSEKYEAIEKYEWTVTDNSNSGKIFTKWTTLDDAQITINGADVSCHIYSY